MSTTRTNQTRTLSPVEIHQVVGDAVAAGLASRQGDRALLLDGISPAMTSRINDGASPFSQLLADVTALNTPPEEGPLPLLQWLENAAFLLGPRAEAARFDRWRLHLECGAAPPSRIRIGIPAAPTECSGRDPLVWKVTAHFNHRPATIVCLWGGPGVGKTTLARELVAEWDEGEGHSPFELMIWIPCMGASGEAVLDQARRLLGRAFGRNYLMSSDAAHIDSALAGLVRSTRTLVVFDEVVVDPALRWFVEQVPISALLTVTSTKSPDFHHGFEVCERCPLELPAADAMAGGDVIQKLLYVARLFRRPPTEEMLSGVLVPASGAPPEGMMSRSDYDRGLNELIRLGWARWVTFTTRLGDWDEAGEQRLLIPGSVPARAADELSPDMAAVHRKRFVKAHLEYARRAMLPDADQPAMVASTRQPEAIRGRWFIGLKLEIVEQLAPDLEDFLHAVDLGLGADGTCRDAVDLGVALVHIVWEAGLPQRRVWLAERLLDPLTRLIDRGDDSSSTLSITGLDLRAARAWCAFDGLGWTLLALGRPGEAQKAMSRGWGWAEEREAKLGRHRTFTWWSARLRLGDLHRACGAFPESRMLLEECWRTGPKEVRGPAARSLGQLELRLGDLRAGREWLYAACQVDLDRDRPRYAVRALLSLARLETDEGNYAQAERILQRARALYPRRRSLRTNADWHLVRGRLLRLMNRWRDARAELSTSLRIFRTLGDAPRVAEAEWESSQLRGMSG